MYSPPKIIYLNYYLKMPTPIEKPNEVLAIPEAPPTLLAIVEAPPPQVGPTSLDQDAQQQETPKLNEDSVINATAVSLSNIATIVAESCEPTCEPTETSATTITDTRKPPPPNSITINLSSPKTRSQSSSPRKRTTPDKYVPSYNSGFKARRIFNSNSSTKKAKTTTKSTTKPAKPKSDVENIEDEDDDSVREIFPALNNSTVLELESDAVAKRLASDEDPENTEKRTAANESERLFHKSLFNVTMRSNANISWAGWTLGIFREIRVSDYGKKYMKTRKYIVRYYCSILFLSINHILTLLFIYS